MNGKERRKLDMARLMLEFIKAQPPSTDAGFLALVSRLEALVARADEVAQTQQAGRSLQLSATRRRNELRRRKIRDQVRYVVRVAERAAVQNPGAVGQIDMPEDGGPLRDFITAAKRILGEARAQKDLLVSNGLIASTLDDLQASLDEFDDETVKQHDGVRDHITARIELEEIASECVRISKAIDGTYRLQFAANPELLAAWNSARRVMGYSPRHRADAPVPPSPAPAPPTESMQAGG